MAGIRVYLRRYCAGPVSATLLLASVGLAAPFDFDSGKLTFNFAQARPDGDNPGRGDEHGNAGGSGGTAGGAGGGGAGNGGGKGGGSDGGSDGSSGGPDTSDVSAGRAALSVPHRADEAGETRGFGRGGVRDSSREPLFESIEAYLYGLRSGPPDDPGATLQTSHTVSRPAVIERLDPAFLDELNRVLDSNGAKTVASQPDG